MKAVILKIDKYYFLKDFEKIEESAGNIIQQSKKTISGKVTDMNGEPFPGVTVIVKGTFRGAITDL